MANQIKIINAKEIEIIKELNKNIFPSRIYVSAKQKPNVFIPEETVNYIKKQITLSVKKGVIKPRDIKYAKAGLLSVGIKEVLRNEIFEVKPVDIKRGWARTRNDFGNCPPAECLFRTVISRKKDFGDDNPIFNDIIEIL